MWVVKLGGSLMRTPELSTWLQTMLGQSARSCVIVPGGGMFADAVRAAQAETGFDDAAAHRMALLAMEQYAWMLKSICPPLPMARSVREIMELSGQHRAMIWMPARMVMDDSAIPMNWQVTSDSLAAWLAAKLSAERLVLVKHADVSANTATIETLQGQGILDAAFAEFAGGLHCPIHVLGKSACDIFWMLIAGAALPALTLAKENAA